MFAIGPHRDRWRHHLGAPGRTGAQVGQPVARHRAAVATVGEDEHAHALGEPAQLEVHLVVDHLAVVEAPGFVLLVRLVAGHVGHLAAVPGVGHEEQITRRERLGCGADRRHDLRTRRLVREQQSSASCPGPWQSPSCRSHRTRRPSRSPLHPPYAAGTTAFSPMCSDNARVAWRFAGRFDVAFFAIEISLYAGCAIFDAWQAAGPAACGCAPGLETPAGRRTNTCVLHCPVARAFPLCGVVPSCLHDDPSDLLSS